MRRSQVVGAVLVCLGLVVLFILRSAVLRLLLLIIEFLGILLEFLLILLGLGLIFGGRLVWRQKTQRWSIHPPLGCHLQAR